MFFAKFKFFGIAFTFTVFYGCRTSENIDSSMSAWNTLNKKWDQQAEVEFSSWIEKLGTGRADQKCNKICGEAQGRWFPMRLNDGRNAWIPKMYLE